MREFYSRQPPDPDVFLLSEEAAQEVWGTVIPPAYLIPADRVAIAVPVEADSAVGFALRKGDRVHVIYVGSTGEEAISKTILTEVEVFDTIRDQAGLGGGDRGGYRTVVLLVTPTDAERVALAKRTGKVDLALVGR